MGAYTEKIDKNVLVLSDKGKNLVKIKMDCFNGATAKLSFISPMHAPVMSCGDTVVIDTVQSLKSKGTIIFVMDAENYSEQTSKVTFTIYEEGGNTLTYEFPKNYTGTPAIVANDSSPFLTFFCKFT